MKDFLTDYKNDIDKIEIKTNNNNNKNTIFQETACHNLLLFFCLTNNSILDNDTTSITEFNIISSSLSTNFMTVGLNFLISATN